MDFEGISYWLFAILIVTNGLVYVSQSQLSSVANIAKLGLSVDYNMDYADHNYEYYSAQVKSTIDANLTISQAREQTSTLQSWLTSAIEGAGWLANLFTWMLVGWAFVIWEITTLLGVPVIGGFLIAIIGVIQLFGFANLALKIAGIIRV